MSTLRTVFHVVLIALAIPVGIAAGLGARHWLQQPQATFPATSAATTAPVATEIATAPATRRVSHPAAQTSAARLASRLLIGGLVQTDAAQGIALENGARFQVRVASNRAGWVELHAVNPLGEPGAQALWRGWVDARGTLTTPMLRLTGTRGLENLRVVLRGEDNRALAQQQFKILHV